MAYTLAHARYELVVVSDVQIPGRISVESWWSLSYFEEGTCKHGMPGLTLRDRSG